MWNRALNPLPTKPMPSRSVVMSFAEDSRVQSAVGCESQLRAIELRVGYAKLGEGSRRASVPVGSKKIPFVAKILHAHLARPEPGRREIAQAIEEAYAITH